MNKDIYWFPSKDGKFNHLYNITTGKAICGSIDSWKDETNGYRMSYKTYWLDTNCPDCKAKLMELKE